MLVQDECVLYLNGHDLTRYVRRLELTPDNHRAQREFARREHEAALLRPVYRALIASA